MCMKCIIPPSLFERTIQNAVVGREETRFENQRGSEFATIRYDRRDLHGNGWDREKKNMKMKQKIQKPYVVVKE